VPTRKVYRVFPWLRGAAETDPGGALYVPPQGAGRFDNPAQYEIFYVAESPEAAIAEAFGRHPLWTASMLGGVPTLPGSVHALAAYELDDAVPLFDLDDAQNLVALKLRPSDVVNRDYTVTQAIALQIFMTGATSGLRWWSFYNPAWANNGVWNKAALSVLSVQPLSIADATLVGAARTIFRLI
jgi:RES domain